MEIYGISDSEIIARHRKAWEKKLVLRIVYHEYYRLIQHNIISGLTLEIGGGCGNFKDMMPDCLTCDITSTPWTDLVADACSLPFRDESWANIVMIDLIHHISDPINFFSEIQRVLCPGGRVIILEPAITPVSHVILSLTHPEPINTNINPFEYKKPSKVLRAFEANQALPTLIFEKYRSHFDRLYPKLQIISHKKMSIFVYPLCGGFRSWNLIPKVIAPRLLKIDLFFSQIFSAILAFRLFIVMEKKDN